MVRRDPSDYLSLAPQLFRLMTTSSNNWMLIKLIKLVGGCITGQTLQVNGTTSLAFFLHMSLALSKSSSLRLRNSYPQHRPYLFCMNVSILVSSGECYGMSPVTRLQNYALQNLQHFSRIQIKIVREI
jgi:hypothetical protein